MSTERKPPPWFGMAVVIAVIAVTQLYMAGQQRIHRAEMLRDTGEIKAMVHWAAAQGHSRK